jgi:undecaprenyl-diphosphatase
MAWRRPVLDRLPRIEWPILVLLLLAAAAVWAFGELAGEVLEGDSHSFDRAVLLALRNPADPGEPLGPRWLQEMMRDFTGLGGTGVLTLITLAVAGYLVLIRKGRTAFGMLVAVGGGMLLSSLLKYGFERPRPDLVPHGTYVYTSSFPSGHSMMSAVVYLTLGAFVARVRRERRIKIFALVLAVLLSVLVGCSRVYLGVHWPTDVLAGWTLGAAWALLCWAAALSLQRRGRIEGESGSPD